MFRQVGIGSAISFGLPGGNDAISCCRSNNSVEDVKEDGSEDDQQNDVQDFPQFRPPRRTLASLPDVNLAPRGILI
ncbi:hypothetical protein, partial [Escherichia coli]|uniref:hypothetical protein n=1 Tax=Escherichia coli TaxID=562 RepID=UPI0032E4908E